MSKDKDWSTDTFPESSLVIDLTAESDMAIEPTSESPPSTDLPLESPQLSEFIKDVRENENDQFKRKFNEVVSENVNVQINNDEISFLVDRLKIVFSVDKSPIQVLHELFPGNNDNFEIIDKGSYGQPHDPMHITCVKIKSIGTFIGKARSKQESKQQAAKNAIEYLNRFNSNPGYIPTKNKKSKKRRNINNSNKKSNNGTNNTNTINDDPMLGKQNNQQLWNASPFERFIEFIPQKEHTTRIDNNINLQLNECPEENFLLDSELSKRIYDAVLEKWAEVSNPINVNKLIDKMVSNERDQIFFKLQDLWRYKELSSFVLVSQIDDSIQVLSIGTGTKSLSSENLSLNGDVVLDSHAEIIARRGLLYVLYDHLEALLANNLQDKPEFILEISECGKRFRLKKHLKLHLFLTSPPCGDARLFNLIKNENEGFNRGKLRIKVEKSQGTVPMPIEYISTWDDVLISSQRFTLMSCSDKIALWNVVGVQGSLLSFFIEPIYIESLVLSNFFRYNHIIRAIHGRIDKVKLESQLQNIPHYKVNAAKVGYKPQSESTSQNNRIYNPIPLFSHNWFDIIKRDSAEIICPEVEILHSETGTIYFNDKESRLCKKEILKRFLQLITSYPNICQGLYFEEKFDSDVLDSNNGTSIKKTSILENENKTYRELKNASHHYQKAKLITFLSFKDCGMGTWIKAPVDIDLFQIRTKE